ncbi:recombinase family protein, partial [Rhizorhabdus histidinilytica]|uniref:recombinase family protein n=1 Tax=Rhizorhabdus histidinilytica TaxID=439228 RepID=UPI0035F0C160
MLVGYMRVSSTDDRQSVDLQRDALTAALLQRLAAVRGRLSLCADQAAAAKWWLSMPMA